MREIILFNLLLIVATNIFANNNFGGDITTNIVYDCTEGSNTYSITLTVSGAAPFNSFGEKFGGYDVTTSIGSNVVDCFNIDAYDPNTFCNPFYEPVCACNGVIYTNAYCAELAGYDSLLINNGECLGTEEVQFTIENIPINTEFEIIVDCYYEFVLLNDPTIINISAENECSLVNSMRPFVTTWVTNNPGVTGDSSIQVPTFPGETYDYEVDVDYVLGQDFVADFTGITGDFEWNAGRVDTVTIAIRGDFPRIYFDDYEIIGSNKDSDKLYDIIQWGDIEWRSMSKAFDGCRNLMCTATDTAKVSNVTSMDACFRDCTMFNGDIGGWDTKNVTDMNVMFSLCENFNQDIGSWNVSKVENMVNMFRFARSFNQDIGNWNVGNVSEMQLMFYGASTFNQDISAWDVRGVNNMRWMFRDAENFNQNIGSWDVSLVTDMSWMFDNAKSFNQDIGNWNVSSVRNMERMFSNTNNFNQNLENWDVTNVEDIGGIFNNAISFDQSLGNWQIEKVNDFQYLAIGPTLLGPFDNSGLSCENYSSTLQGWAANPNTPNNLEMQALGMQYNQIGANARDQLLAKDWMISGDSPCENDCSAKDSEITINANLSTLCSGDTLKFNLSIDSTNFDIILGSPNSQNYSGNTSQTIISGGNGIVEDILINESGQKQIIEYFFFVDDGTCTGDTLKYIIVVNPTPLMAFNLPQSSEEGEGLTINLTVWNTINGPFDINVSGFTIDYNATSEGNGAQENINIPGFMSAGLYNLKITVTDSKGCMNTYDASHLVLEPAGSYCGLTGDQLICQEWLQQILYNESDFVSNCETPNCNFTISIGDYLGQEVIVIREDCMIGLDFSSYWVIYDCNELRLEECSIGLVGTCNNGAPVLDNTIISEIIYDCSLRDLPDNCNCQDIQCATINNLMLTPSNEVTLFIQDAINNPDASCNYSFSESASVTQLTFNCNDLGQQDLVVYNLDDPRINCQISFEIIDDGNCGSNPNCPSTIDSLLCLPWIKNTIPDTTFCSANGGLSYVEIFTVPDGNGGNNILFHTLLSCPNPPLDAGTYTLFTCDSTVLASCNYLGLAATCADPLSDPIIGPAINNATKIFDSRNDQLNCSRVLPFTIDQFITVRTDSSNAINTLTNCTLLPDQRIYTPCDNVYSYALISNLDKTRNLNWSGEIRYNGSVIRTTIFSDTTAITPGDCQWGWWPNQFQNEGTYGVTLFIEDVDSKEKWSLGEVTYEIQTHPDFAALMELYNNTNGSSWVDKTGWEQGAQQISCNPCNYNGEEWYGVNCENGRVKELVLVANNLNGTLSNSLANLDSLTTLKLSINNLTGELPDNLGNLSNLEELKIGRNNLTGNIPSSLYQISNLTELWLYDNMLEGNLSSSISNWTSLRSLALYDNNLSGELPEVLGQFNNMAHIDLSDNNFSGCFPTSLDNYCNLGHLDRDVIEGFGGSSQITASYNFQRNHELPFSGDYENICSGGNQIGSPCGENGEDIINENCACVSTCAHPDFQALIDFYDATNGANWSNNSGWLEGKAGNSCDPCSWYGITCLNNRVVCIDLDGNPSDCQASGAGGNNVRGEIPNTFNTLDSLKFFLGTNMTNNTFGFLSGMKELERLELRVSNTVAIPIIGDILDLSNLKELTLGGDIRGTIPSNIDQLSRLETIDITNTDLTGTIPNTFYNLTSLKEIRLNNNSLFGSIDSRVQQLSEVEFINLQDNNISGPIPIELAGLNQLRHLALSNNQLTDTIPSGLGNLNFTLLWLQENNLEGCIPDDLQQLCGSNFINISNNPNLDNDNWDLFCSQSLGICEQPCPSISWINIPSDMTISCDDLGNLNLDLAYTNNGEGDCEFTGSITADTMLVWDNCDRILFLDWAASIEGQVLEAQQRITISNIPDVQWVDLPADKVIPCDDLDQINTLLIYSNGESGICKKEGSLEANIVISTDPCNEARTLIWTLPEDECQSEITHVQKIDVSGCFPFEIRDDFLSANTQEALSFDLLDNDIYPVGEHTIQVIDINNPLLVDTSLNQDGEFTFSLSDSFFDTIKVVYQVCDTLCIGCDTATLFITDEILEDIIPTTVFTPNNDGQNDVLQFTRDPIIEDSELWVYNRWGDQIFNEAPYTNSWDASGIPSGVYFYVLRVKGVELKKTLTILK